MDEKGLEMRKVEALIESFMDKLCWEEYRYQLPEDEIESFITYIGDIPMYDYEEIYEKISGNPSFDDLWLSEETLFTLVIDVCAAYIYAWNFTMKGILALLFAMRYSPENHKKDIAIWKEVLTQICNTNR
ncbi:hypothetical protein [Candidatus Rhabdochlamydia sp. T3358]|uniref:hypothetical protein n=1 Tax=Candidatus Rhabdochlamydia sp. T3358 TaxID=2099795 RepID=UPI0010B1C1F4|nr:hypothetical protein [Candidatus Rhabdochlamydia sp. T3358]VHO04424.1 hypothetical protein RHT_01386 [Candidatus Rhabdochlamydia sp. T3358]